MQTDKTHFHRTQALAVLAAALLLAALLAGCGARKPALAVKLPPLPAGLNAPVYVVLNDVTTHDAAVSAARAAAFEALVSAAWQNGAGVVLVTAGSTPDSVRTVFSTVAVASDVNGSFKKRRENGRTRAMLDLFKASDAEQTAGTVNVLAALREVQTQLRSLGNGRFEALIMSSGQMRAPLDLVKNPQFLADPAATAGQLASAGRLPSLAGWRVAFQSIGSVSDERALALAALWWQVIAKAGAQMTGFQQAILSWPQPALPEPRAPGIVRVPAAPGKVVVRVSDSVLFDYDKATLRRDAAAAVATLVALLAHRYPGAPATITGYTDSSGAADYNLSLSHARAAAVAAALVARGISRERLSITGRGASDFIASNETAAGRQANRRVEITLSVE